MMVLFNIKEFVILSMKVVKYNYKKKEQLRIFIITNKAYNLKY